MAVQFNPQQLQQRFADIIPDGFECPVNLEVMQNPVIHKDCGNSFELAAVTTWLQLHQSCMMCQAHATMADFVVNRNLSDGIQGLSTVVLPRLADTEDRLAATETERDQLVQQRDELAQQNGALEQQRIHVVQANAVLQERVGLLRNENQLLTTGFQQAFWHHCPQEAEAMIWQIKASMELINRALEVCNASEAQLQIFSGDHRFVRFRKMFNTKMDFYDYFKIRTDAEGNPAEKARLERESKTISKEGSVHILNWSLIFTNFLDIELSDNPYNAHEATDSNGNCFSSYLVSHIERYIEVDRAMLDETTQCLQGYIEQTNRAVAMIPRAQHNLDSFQKKFEQNQLLLDKTSQALDAIERTNPILRDFSHFWRSGHDKLIFISNHQMEQLAATTRVREEIRQRIRLAQHEMIAISRPLIPVDDVLNGLR